MGGGLEIKLCFFTDCKIVYQVVFWRFKVVLQKTEYLKEVHFLKVRKTN